MPTEDANLLVEILRAAGHDEAARLATAVLRPEAATDAASKPNATPDGEQAQDAEAAALTPEQAEGRALITALNEHVRPGWTSTPMFGENKR